MSDVTIRGIVVCVNYDDLLKITLERNMRHLDECVVVTSYEDAQTFALVQDVASRCNVHLLQTNAFYRYGAKFNKGLAMEEGFDILGRTGWIIVWDADTLFPEHMPIREMISVGRLRGDMLYSPYRLLLDDPRLWTPDFDWTRANNTFDGVFAGYFQLFEASDPHLNEKPWYDVTFTHAGGGDGAFQARWPDHKKERLPFKVLHLGPRDTNWCGRISVRADGGTLPVTAPEHGEDMRAFLSYKGWRGRKTLFDFNEHVNVPGHKPTGFVP